MANVLADLFQDTADAIRTKTGGTAKIAPADFPKEILSIANVINGGGGETEGNLKIASGVFFAGTEGNNVRQIVNHGLGEIPDFVFVCFTNGTQFELTNSAVHLVSAWGMNSRLAPLGAGVGQRGSYSTHGCYINATGETPVYLMQGNSSVTNYGMDELPDTTNFDYHAWISTPDENTFEVGANTNNRFWPGGTYYWIAISGVGATAESAENLSF